MRGAIFDLDGTLLDSMWVWDEVDRRFLAKRGIALPDDYMDAVKTMEFSQAAHYTIERFHLKETEKTLISEWEVLARQAYAHEVKLKPMAKTYLDVLKKRNVLLGIATSAMEGLFLPALQNNGIDRYFGAFATTNEVARGKEAPDVYLAAARKLGLEPGECVVYEDTLQGIISAKSAGFFTVGVYDASAEREKRKIMQVADRWIDSFAALL